MNQMASVPEHEAIKTGVLRELETLGIRATPQAQNAITQSILGAPGDISGDSDSLLSGLLRSGSYTVDALELAGADPRRLQELAHDSIWAPLVDDGGEGLRTFFHVCSASQALLSHGARKGSLETADIVRYAIAPVGLGEFGATELEGGSLDDAIRRLVLDRLREIVISQLWFGKPYPEREFRERICPLAPEECYQIRGFFDETLGEDYRGFGEYCIGALNQWFCERRVVTPPADYVTRLIEFSIDDPLDFGAHLFMKSGGSYETLETSLLLSQRINPERDACGIVLCCRNNRVFAAEYTYRNSLDVDTGDSQSRPWQRLGIQAIRPVPLVSDAALVGLRDLLSNDSTSEDQIQQFLNRYPEVLTSFGGYSGSHPHVLLREEGKTDMVPDYLLELPVDRRFDILDLKLHTTRLSVGGRYKRMSAELQKAVAQLRAYQNFFDESQNRKWFIKEYGLEPFKPEIVVVMGRDSEFASREERREIEGQLSPTRLLTYDDVIAYARARIIEPRLPNALG
jgi:hypothetical protein